MNKTLRFSLLSMLVMLCSSMWADYQKVTSVEGLRDGAKYLIVYETGSVAFNGALTTLDAVSNTVDVTIADGKIASTDEIDAATFTIDLTNETVKSASGYFIGQTANSNGLKSSTSEEYKNTVSFDESGNALFTTAAGPVLKYNKASDQLRFRYYKSGQQDIQLYIEEESVPEEGEKVYATFENPTGITWDAENKTFEWSSQYGNQLHNIGLPSGNLTGYEKLVVDCEILSGDGYRIMFYSNQKGSTAGGVTIINESGKKEFKLTDFAMDQVYLTDCSEICLSGYNEAGQVKVKEVYLVKSNDPLAGMKELLSETIALGKAYNDFGKTAESFATLTDAIAAAEAAYAAGDATEASLTAAKTAIEEAIAGLQLQEGYTALTADMFKHYASLETPGEGSAVGCVYDLFNASSLAYGDGNVGELNWADLTNYDKLIVVAKDGMPRFCMNRLVAGGQQAETQADSKMLDINPNNEFTWSTEKYQTIDGNVYIIDLKKIVDDYGFARLHSIKGAHYGTVYATDLLLYKDPASSSGVTADDFLINADFSSTEGWTANHSSGFYAMGNGLIGTYQVYTQGAAPTVDENHPATSYAFGFECRWETNYANYTQETTQELPAGVYMLTYDVEQTNGSAQAKTWDNLFSVTVGGTVYKDAATEWMKAGKSPWTNHNIVFVVTEPAKVTVSLGFGTGSNNIGAANTPCLYVSNLKLQTVDVPVIPGTYYLYNEASGKYLSRGSSYGTKGVVDDYGFPINVKYDVKNECYELSNYDGVGSYGLTDFYADASTVWFYNFAKVDGGYSIANTTNGGYVYAAADGIAQHNGAAVDATSTWQLLTKAERDAKIAEREAAQKAAAITSAGVVFENCVEDDATELKFGNGHGWTQTIVRSQGGQPQNEYNVTEMWNGTINFARTVEGLPAGLYKVTINAFFRDGDYADNINYLNDGYNMSVAYLEANGNKALVKNWAVDRTSDGTPNGRSSANTAFNEGKYESVVYTYVGEDGKLELFINDPAWKNNCWFIVGKVTYAKMLDPHQKALKSEIAKAEAMADADAPMVGWLYDAIDEAKAVFDNNAATAEELDAAVEALQLAEADYTQHNTPSAETTINVTDKVSVQSAAWGGVNCPGGSTTNSLGVNSPLAEVYGNAGVGVIMNQTVTGLENGTYVVKVFATSHNARGEGGATLDGLADDVAYVFANDAKTWITASGVTPGFLDGELTTPIVIDNVQVTDGTLNIGLALDQANKTGWHTIQIYELGQYAPAKLAYQTKREALNEAIVEVQAWADNTAMTNGKETLNDAIAAAQAVYESNKVTPAEVDAAAAAVRAAVKAYIEANPAEIANGAYYVKNNNGLFLAAGADWGTHAVVNETGLDYTFALADGKYTLDSQVSNGGNSNFLNGVWNDGAAMGWGIYKVSETEVIITNGNGYLAPNGNNFVELVSEITDAAKWTIVAAADRQAELLATLDAATATNGVDATFLLKGANFNRNDMRNSAWVVSRSGGSQTIAGPGENRGTYGCESWNNTFEVKQALTELPQGVYEFQMAGFGTNGTTMIYGDVVFGTTMAPFVNTTSAANFRTALDAIANGEFTGNTSGKFIVTDGNATVGVKRDVNQAADWAVFDNARLVYFGNDLSFYVEAYEKAVAAANAIKDKKMSAAAKSVLDEALATYGDVDRESREAMIEAVPVLNEATAAAKAAIEAYEVAKAALNDIAAVLNKTNVYTPEAYSAFKVDFEAKRRAFKEGELTDEEAIAIREAILPTGYRQDNTIDDLLLSAWRVNGEQCKDYEKALYINTWSTEGDTDGSGFKAPFFEYYSNQENEFTATMNNVEPGIYNVTAWVRVRSGNDEPAAGVTFQANDTEAVDVCDGDELWSGANHFFLKNVETVATVAEDGVLTLTFKVAAGNNCNWLSFKDVMFTMDVQATANAEKAAQMADAQGQVDDAKAELADAILAAQEVYNTGDVRYPSAVELAEAIVNAQAALDGTADLTKLSQLNKTLVALNNALDEINNAKDAAEANLMGEHVIYFWPAGTEQANEITLAEGVTLAITGNTSKKIQNGSNVTVYGKKYTSMKVSNGAQNTLTTQKYVKSITFYSYINKKHDADGLRDSYWKEVAGVAYDAETSGGLMSLYSDGNLTKPEGRYFEISDKDHPTKTVTFNNAGEQLCYVMDVEYWDETVGVEEVSAARLVKAEDVYNLQGQKVERPVKGGLYIVGGRKVVVK